MGATHNFLWLNRHLTRAEAYSEGFRHQIGRKTPPNPNLVLVGFENVEYKDFPEDLAKSRALQSLTNAYPWSREVWAELTDNLLAAGAKGVVFDIVFRAAMERDEQFAEVVRRHRDRVALSTIFQESDTQSGGALNQLAPGATVIPDAGDDVVYDPRVCFATIWPDGDSVVRRARFRISESSLNMQLDDSVATQPGERFQQSLAARALHLMGRAGAIPPGERPVAFRFTDVPAKGFPFHPLNEMFVESIWKQRYQDGTFFKGKLVLVGPMAEILHDVHRTPMADAFMPGPEIHLNIINAALHREFLRNTSGNLNQLLILGAGGLAIVCCWLIRDARLRLLVLLGVAILFGIVSLQLFNRAGVIVLTAVPIIAVVVCGIGALGYDFWVEKQAKDELRKTMDIYFSPKVSAYVLENPGSMEARSAEVTLLLTDLRNSTPLAEKLGPGGMFTLLNQVFEVETNAVMGQDGALEHFLGDQFLTYWGAPLPQPDGANQALRAAMELIQGMESVKAAQSPEVKALFGYGVALHCGSVLFGNKGSAKRLDFGLVGDTINEAARMEALTKYYHVTLLVSRECFVKLTSPGLHRLLDRVIVKGKSTPVELLEIENPRTPPNYGELVKDWDAAFADYTSGKFAAARPVFAQLAERFNDGPSQLMVHRCDELTALPPADWHGVWRMESK
ncbi:MAG: adenylate/guanylate cyclase domain-containing protein [Verrucomicrobia bacterium]|nr:adenylate/guanylate cyclase domain-containing protein [Verrucomicrobiota bacterium]